MVDIRKPRRGSLAVRPRKRAKQHVKRFNAWPRVSDKAVLGFAGYKVGMTTISWMEEVQGSKKGMEVVGGATVVETPPMVVYGIRAIVGGQAKDIYTDDKDIMKKLGSKKLSSSFKEGMEPSDVRLLAFAQPFLTTTGKKHIERMELGVGGSSVEEKMEFANSLLGKEIGVKDVVKPGMFLDVMAATKGKGWQGPVKRFGVATQRRKATGKIRHVGTLGPFHPAYVQYTVPMPGQMGFHKRTELNKLVMAVIPKEDLDKINPKSGWPHYGVVRNDCIILKGSVPGPSKRIVRMRMSVRKDPTAEPKLMYIDNMPKN